MDYEINTNRMNFYLRTDFWILDSFDIDVLEGILYYLILKYEPFIWTSDYIAATLKSSKSTVLRMVKRLEEKQLIKKEVINNGSKNKWILVALYNEKGKRPLQDINSVLEEGRKKLENLQKKNYKILRRKMLRYREQNDPMNILIDF